MREKIFQENIKIISNYKISEEYFKIILKSRMIAAWAKPGQFIEIKVTGDYEPFLRRPFSIHRVRAETFEILYEVVGEGTELLSQRKPAEFLDVIGPLGNEFNYKSPGHQVTRSPVLVAGGMGVAPLIFLAEKLMERKAQNAKRKIIVLLGANTKDKILCERDFRNLGCEVKISTDDGSKGFKGKVTDLLKYLLSTIDHRPSTIYACGPRPMLKEISDISQRYKIPAQVSLEEHMACGIGVCFGCVVNTKEGFKRVCKEGPVFNADEIIWERGK